MQPRARTRNGLDIMIKHTGTQPQVLRCYDVVATLGVGGSHSDMVDDLRLTARRRFAANRRNGISGWLRGSARGA